MDLRQSLNDVSRERAENEQVKELNEDQEETIEFNPDLDDVAFWIQLVHDLRSEKCNDGVSSSPFVRWS